MAMTIDELIKAIKEWGKENDARHFMFLAVGDEDDVYGFKGAEIFIADVLARAMREKKSRWTKQYAMRCA